MSSVLIGDKRVGADVPLMVVATLDATASITPDIARRAIEAAAQAGAHAIKLPSFTVAAKQVADVLGLLCFSAPLDEAALFADEALQVAAFEVGALELSDLPWVERLARTGKPLLLATALATFEEIEAAVKVCREAGNEQLVVLREATDDAVDLQSLGKLRELGTVVGVADHTRGATTSIAAVALGAKLIDKRFVLEPPSGGVSAASPSTPRELATTIQALHDAARALGATRFGPAESEHAGLALRRSLVVTRDFVMGDTLTCDHVRSVRHARGASPAYLPHVLGQRATRAARAGDPFALDMSSEAEPIAITLRDVAVTDAARLLGWRNDDTTRAMAISHVEVAPAAHNAWLVLALASDERLLKVAEHQGSDIGVVRLDRRAHGEWDVSLTLAPEQRGKRFAVQLLRAIEAVARLHGALRLVAQMRVENEAAVRAFKRAGYYGFTQRDTSDGVMLSCERRLAAYPD